MYMQQAFHSLNHQGQVRRLAALARSVLRAYSLHGAQLRLLTYSWTTTFRVTASSGDQYVLRVYPGSQRADQPICSELLWLAALWEDGLPVPEPVLNQEQRLVTWATDPGVPEPRLCVLLRWIEGRFLYQRLTPSHLTQAGDLMARLHGHAAQWRRPPEFTRHRVDNLDLTQRDQDDQFDPAAAERAIQIVTSGSTTEAGTVVAAAIPRVWATLKALSEDSDSFGLVHADLHHRNFLFGQRGIGAIDFDCCGYGHWIYDLVVPLTQLDRHPAYAELREALFTGYCRRRLLPAEQEANLETFLALRMVQELVWLTEQKKQFALVDPNFHGWWEDDVAAALAGLRSFIER
jgi:Ser/Thr protein kinase RdoA (MazF antagonist)